MSMAESIFESEVLVEKAPVFLTYEITSSFLFTIKFMSYIDTEGWHSIQYHLVCTLS